MSIRDVVKFTVVFLGGVSCESGTYLEVSAASLEVALMNGMGLEFSLTLS